MRAPVAPDWRFAEEDEALQARARALPARFDVLLDFAATHGIAHSPTLHERRDGALEALWFAGSREGARDVVIARRVIRDAEGRGVDEPKPPIADAPGVREAIRPAQAVHKLGNSVVVDLGGETPFLAVTTVSVGGWAMSKVALLPLGPDGDHVRPGRHLSLGPLLNRSYLVRAPAVRYADGGLGLPLYHEQIDRFGELVRLDRDGRVVAKGRMSRGRHGIQPAIAVLGPRRAVAFLRNFAGARDMLLATWTEDGGRSWTPLVSTGLPSLNSPAATLRLSTGQVLIAFNEGASRRDRLVLALSADDGRSFRTVEVLEDGVARPGDARYPTMIRLRDGSIALVYSVRSRGGIRALAFTEAWIAGRLEDKPR